MSVKRTAANRDDTIVELRLFTGIRNHFWSLSADDARTLEQKLSELPPAPVFSKPIVRRSWYDGFMVHRPVGTPVIVSSGFAYDPTWRVVRKDEDLKLELFLYGTIPPELMNVLTTPGELAPTFAFMSRPLIAKHEITGIEGDAGPVGGLGCQSAPVFPGPHGVWKSAQDENNCYNYANNEPAQFGMSAIPGGGKDNVSTVTASSVRKGAEADKLTFVGTKLPAICPVEPDAHFIALCLRETPGLARDFHCLRMDRSGKWSHKDGSKEVRNDSDDDVVIKDLRKARWFVPMKLVGFFLSVENVRRIKAPEDP